MFFFFNDTATTEIYTLSLHDALPISAANTNENSSPGRATTVPKPRKTPAKTKATNGNAVAQARSEEHTSELQSRQYLVCRLLLEKKKRPDPAYTAPAVPVPRKSDEYT